ncbi:MAG TPA: hypothetical protein VJL58_10285 [Pyrinomonadaceae bacterium]|nr:hypothetical protein [Pyrinomonadaceae bacterium]
MEKSQYVLGFAIVATMFAAAFFPFFIALFVGLFGYFILKLFTSGSRNETREIFEFYLSANEILRDDERRWFGFEIKEVIHRGESIAHRLDPAPPLVHFALGALYNKAGCHLQAEKELALITENPPADELALTSPSQEMRNYVRILRRIEREPADAPQTSAAVRALERGRKLRAKTLLADSRERIALAASVEKGDSTGDNVVPLLTTFTSTKVPEEGQDDTKKSSVSRRFGRSKKNDDIFADRKPISEVLHDIYDSNNIQ